VPEASISVAEKIGILVIGGTSKPRWQSVDKRLLRFETTVESAGEVGSWSAEGKMDTSVLPDWESFTLTYTAAPSFQAPYAVRLGFERGRLHLWFPKTRTSDPFRSRDEGVPKGAGRVLPRGDALRILDILKNAQLTPAVAGGIGLDGVQYSLSLKQGLNRLELTWWQDLPEGWRGLQPLQHLLEEYVSAYAPVSPKEYTL